MSGQRQTDAAERVAPSDEETRRAATEAQEQVEEVDKGPGAPMQHGENR